MGPTTARILTFTFVFAAAQALAATSSTEPPIAPDAAASAQATGPSQPGPSEATQNQTPPNQASTGQAAPSTAAPAPARDAAVASEPRKITKIVLRDDTVSDSQLKQIVSAGYHPEKRADGVRYCRREAQLGTRFEKKICRTATEIREEQAYAKEVTETAVRGRHGEKGMPASGGQ